MEMGVLVVVKVLFVWLLKCRERGWGYGFFGIRVEIIGLIDKSEWNNSYV